MSSSAAAAKAAEGKMRALQQSADDRAMIDALYSKKFGGAANESGNHTAVKQHVHAPHLM
jgi:hypothetical protein